MMSFVDYNIVRVPKFKKIYLNDIRPTFDLDIMTPQSLKEKEQNIYIYRL